MKYIQNIFIFLVIATFPFISCAQTNSSAPLQYQVREVQDPNTVPPVLILLHGLGSNPQDMMSISKVVDDNWLVFSLQGPLEFDANGYKWSTVDFSSGEPSTNPVEAEQSRIKIIQFLEWMRKNYTFDKERVILCGFSQGSLMSYAVSLTRPDLVSSVAIMSGRMLEDFKHLVAINEKFSDLSYFIGHGTEDKVLKIQYAREALQYLKTLGISPEYHEYNSGHTIIPEELDDLAAWLRKQ